MTDADNTDNGNRYKQKIHWRDTMREPRLIIFDARLVFFCLILAFNLAIWTALMLFTAICVFWLVERAGYRLPSALRAVRATFAGPRRPAYHQRQYREAVDYGFEYRLTPLPPDAVQAASVSSVQAPVKSAEAAPVPQPAE